MENVANEGKSLIIETGGVRYERIPVKTHIITDKDTVSDVLVKYIKPLMREGDICFMSEKAVACTQKRAVKMSDIHPRPLAKLLSRFVYKTPYGIGLGIPETMEMALQECGTVRILFAAVISIVGKLLGRRGWFYMIAGDKARSIDGPCDYTLPPYNEYVVLGPRDPEETAREAAAKSGVTLFTIVDLNDLGGNILGVSDPSLKPELLLEILKDNPLGQTNEQTPLGIIRKAEATTSEAAVKAGAEVTAIATSEPVVTNPVRDWVEGNMDRMLDDLRRIIRIRSVADASSETKPFGQGCRNALDEMLKICGEHGIEAQNHEYYCGSAYLAGSGDREAGIWTHLDVVPDTGDWNYPPYGGEVADGFIIGRGATDNKSAAILGLYVMLYFKENNIKLKNSIRVFFGCDEECGMTDQKHYLESGGRLPDFSLIPDASFPVGYSEKGILKVELVSGPLSGDLLALNAGSVSNMVADKAAVRLVKTPELLGKITGLPDVSVRSEFVEIKASGRTSHAAYPQGSLNAIYVLANLLVENGLLRDGDRDTFSFIRDICGDYTGTPLGINVSDEEFGELTCIAGMLGFEGGKAVLSLNIRYPYGEDGLALATVIKARCLENGFTVENIIDDAPSCVPKDGNFVRTLVSTYNEVAEDDAKPYIMCGGTYARHLPNAVAFGHMLSCGKARKMDLPEGHGDIHQPDEAFAISDFAVGLESYVNALKKLDDIAW